MVGILLRASSHETVFQRLGVNINTQRTHSVLGIPELLYNPVYKFGLHSKFGLWSGGGVGGGHRQAPYFAFRKKNINVNIMNKKDEHVSVVSLSSHVASSSESFFESVMALPP